MGSGLGVGEGAVGVMGSRLGAGRDRRWGREGWGWVWVWVWDRLEWKVKGLWSDGDGFGAGRDGRWDCEG